MKSKPKFGTRISVEDMLPQIGQSVLVFPGLLTMKSIFNWATNKWKIIRGPKYPNKKYFEAAQCSFSYFKELNTPEFLFVLKEVNSLAEKELERRLDFAKSEIEVIDEFRQ